MHASIAKKLAKKMKRQAGFTLLEILVVLTIMGFLIAMVAPRLAGISGGAVDTVCDSNQNRMITMMSGYYEKTSRYPDKLTNIVEQTTADAYQIPAVSDDDPENGAETIASEFMARNKFRIHYLNAAEVAELKNMGIVNVFNLNAYDAYNDSGTSYKTGFTVDTDLNPAGLAPSVTKAPAMQRATVSDKLAVMMVGAGAETNADTPNWDIETDERGWGEGDFIFRIVLGFGPENGLVTSGIISNAAHCPGGIQNSDNVTYNDYNIVLPRLEATVSRLSAENVGGGTLNGETLENGYVAAIAYESLKSGEYDINGNADNLKVRTFNVFEKQPKWNYATMCPEGHKFPADDEEFWGLDLSGDVEIPAL